MTKCKGGKIRFIYGIFLSLLLLFVGALLIRQVWSIYRSAPESPFTTTAISKHFKEIALPVWVSLAAIVGNIFLAMIFPEKESRPKAYIDGKTVLYRTQKRLPKEEESLIKAEEIRRKHARARIAVYCVFGIVVLGLLVVALGTTLDWFYFPWIEKAFFSQHDGAVDRLVQCVSLACLAFIFGSVGAGLLERSRKAERNGYLDIIAQSKKPNPQEKAEEEESRWNCVVYTVLATQGMKEKKAKKLIDAEIAKATGEEVLPEKKGKPLQIKKEKEKKENAKAKGVGVALARIALAAVGITFVVIGILNGGMHDVLVKAINICTQCIGLG